MNAHLFYDLTDSARSNAVDLYYMDAMTLVPARLDILALVDRHGWRGTTTLEDVAVLMMESGGWLFNHLGERIA